MTCVCIPEVREKENGGGKLSPLVVLTQKKCVLIHREIDLSPLLFRNQTITVLSSAGMNCGLVNAVPNLYRGMLGIMCVSVDRPYSFLG